MSMTLPEFGATHGAKPPNLGRPMPKQAAVIVTDGPQRPMPAAVLGRHVTRQRIFRRQSVLNLLSGSTTRSRVLGRGAAGDILDELA